MSNKVLKASFLAVGAMTAIGTLLVDTQEAFAQAGSTVGSLRGQLKDKATGEVAVGATVVATSPALVGEQVVITDDTGQYFISSLPPGLYTLTIYYNNRPFSRQGVLIQLGKEAVVNVTVDSATATGAPNGEVIVIKGTVPIIDQGSTKTGTTLTDEYTRNIPTGRTFGAVLGASAGSQGDFYGTSISGATSAENTYIVEGINTTDTGFGGLSSNLPNEFIQETEIITGGYNAEYGRATGGIVNVVTKTGGNEFHGSVFGYFRPSAFIADAKTIEREGSSIDSKTDLNYNYDFGVELGGPIIKDKLWFHVGVNPSITKQTTTRLVQTQIDEDGLPGADTDANGFVIHKCANVDSTGRCLSQSEIPANFNTYFFTAKITGAINQNNQFQIAAFGNPRNAEDLFAVTRNPAATRWKYDDGAYDLSGKYTSKFNEGKTQVDVVLGFHRGYENQKPFRAADDVPLVFERANHNRSLFDFAEFEGDQTIAACNDGSADDPYPKIQNCPTLGYASQGLGFLEKRINDRKSAIISLTQRVKLGDQFHTFKAGLDAELSTYNSTRRYTGAQIFRHNALERADRAGEAPGRGQAQWQLREFMRILPAAEGDPSMPLETGQVLCAGDRAVCQTTDHLEADTNNRGVAAYLQDSWQIRPNLTLNAGVRWEQQVGYTAKALQGQLAPTNEVIPDRAYALDNLLAPRIGFIYDPTREGKSKIFGHFGRFYENVPMDLNVRSFGGEITNFTVLNANRRVPGSATFDPNCRGDLGAGLVGPSSTPDLATQLSMCTDRVQQTLIGEGVEFVSPNLKGQYTQEIILGTEYEVMSDLKVGMNYIHRSMPQVIEDISTDGGNNYLITNPGENLDKESKALGAQAQGTLMAGGCVGFDPQMQPDGCDADKLALATLQQSRSDQLSFVKRFDKPSRNYDAVQLTATQRPTKASLLIASYTYSVSKGNYPGLFSTETTQLDPNITSLYDLPDLMANRYGNLGLDRPHNLKIDGFYSFDFKSAGRLVTGGSFRAQSGLPHNVLGASPHPGYGTGEAYILPRGDEGRSPVTSEFDIHISYGRKLSKTTMLEAFVNVFNLLNQQDETSTDDNYTFDFTNPIVGGDLKDAAHAKVITDPLLGGGGDTKATVAPNKNFGHTASRQAPRNVQLGLRLTF